MNLTTFIENYLNTIDFTEEDNLRYDFFNAVSNHNVYRLFYFRPDMAEIILHKVVDEMIEGHKSIGDTKVVEYFERIKSLFSEVSGFEKVELHKKVCESYIKMDVCGIIFTELEKRGPQSIPSLKQEIHSETFFEKISYYKDLRNSSMSQVIKNFPIEIAEFEKNEFCDYGDEEEEYNEEELDEVIDNLELKEIMIPSDIEHEHKTYLMEDEDLRTQQQLVDDYMQELLSNIMDTRESETSHGFFPFDYRIKSIRKVIGEDVLGLDDEHLKNLVEQINQLKIPNYSFVITCERKESKLITSVRMLGFTDTSKN